MGLSRGLHGSMMSTRIKGTLGYAGLRLTSRGELHEVLRLGAGLSKFRTFRV